MFSDNSDFFGFSVDLGGVSTTYTAGDVIIFMGQNLNEGAGYDTTTGLYSCPVTGVYFVTLTVMKYGNEPVQLGLHHNGTIILHTVKEYSAKQQYPNIHNSRLVSCVKGEKILVKGVGSGQAYNGASHTSYTTLSAILVERDNQGKFSKHT